MIPVPVSTIEKPLTAIDFIASLQQCISVAQVASYGERVPEEIKKDERFAKAVAARLAAIHEKPIHRRETA